MAIIIKILDSILEWFVGKLLDWGIKKAKEGNGKYKPKKLSKKDLMEVLGLKYGQTEFYISDDDLSFIKLISDKLVSEIKRLQKENSYQANQKKKPGPIRVGIICGPMVYRVQEYLEASSKSWNNNEFHDVEFVAMNKAAEATSFRYSANYLVAQFTSIFPGSKAISFTNNQYDIEKINIARRKINILFCSLGSSHSKSLPNYIEIWSEQMKDPKLAIPDNCIGEFCLIPIDNEGFILESEELLQGIDRDMAPFPSVNDFERLGEFSKSFDTDSSLKIILPIRTTTSLRQIEVGTKNFQITGKELIAKIMLNSGIISKCILSKTLAENIQVSIGHFLLKETSTLNSITYLRSCKGYSFLEDLDNQDITVYDPNNVMESHCPLNTSIKTVVNSSSRIPEIIVSEFPQKEGDRVFNWESLTGKFLLKFRNNELEFDIDEGVRKPGQWASITSSITIKYIQKTFAQKNKKVSIWDLGSGSGVIGILSAKYTGNKVKSILFSDINKGAVKCTESNAKLHSVHEIAEYRIGSLFAPNYDQKYDVIVFNPPFFPKNVIKNESQSDVGGLEGWELAKEFCTGLKYHLSENGWGILVVSDFIDNNREILKSLTSNFGSENVKIENRIILYPFETQGNVPKSYEVQEKERIEKMCNYRFETIVLAGKKYISYKMRHYLIHNRGQETILA